MPTWASDRKSERKLRSISATVTPALKPECASEIDIIGVRSENQAGA
ncbi:hypothetical protein ACVWZ3_009127 [Bradyrhizobium sp. i1.3.6]